MENKNSRAIIKPKDRKKDGGFMKKFLAAVFAVIMIFSFSGCGISFMAEKIISDSDIFTEDEINSAMFKVYKKFGLDFEGCILIELEYDEKYSKERAKEWAENYGYDEGIVLLSKFYVAAEGDGSLAVGETYDGWNWILVRNKGGVWRLVTWGYG